MTEDDTFRRLKRIPLTEMEQIIVNLNISSQGVPEKWQYFEAFRDNGWTRDEYREQLFQKYN